MIPEDTRVAIRAAQDKIAKALNDLGSAIAGDGLVLSDIKLHVYEKEMPPWDRPGVWRFHEVELTTEFK